MNTTTTPEATGTKRPPLKKKIHIVTDEVTKTEYLVRAKTRLGAIAAVSRRYSARQATADDIDERRDMEVIDATDADDAGGE